MAFPLYQCNLNKSISASANLLEKVMTLCTFIYLISEQYTYRGRTKKLGSSYNLLESTLEDNKTAILAHPDISIWMRPEFTNQYVTAALWKTGCPLMGDVRLFSVYWHHSQTGLPRKLIQGIEFCRTEQSPVRRSSLADPAMRGRDQPNRRGMAADQVRAEI